VQRGEGRRTAHKGATRETLRICTHLYLQSSMEADRPSILRGAEPTVIALLEPAGIVSNRLNFISRKIYYTSCRSSNAASFTWEKEGDIPYG
jgi:hypothetical protein